MKKLLGAIILTSIIGVSMTANAAGKGDAKAGEKVFAAKCQMCHVRGSNPINPKKTLRMKDLKANKLDNVAAIVAYIAKPSAPTMPANLVKGKDAENVAAFIIQAKF